MILVNGEHSELAPGATVQAVVARLGIEPEARGIAVAVDGEVVPRAAWGTFALSDEARVEVLTAMQGG
ncbi:MAG TPA: sulfur carrier protein ThiS [Solirubrobacteraceae bacterium]|nr:sulfur carrier protein ThiS [Solirubrobacteraceae bacterium]